MTIETKYTIVLKKNLVDLIGPKLSYCWRSYLPDTEITQTLFNPVMYGVINATEYERKKR